MLRAIIATFRKNNAKHMNNFYGKMRKFLILWQGVNISKE